MLSTLMGCCCLPPTPPGVAGVAVDEAEAAWMEMYLVAVDCEAAVLGTTKAAAALAGVEVVN